MKTGLLACLRSQLDDIKLERLIKWYFYKIGAAFVSIPAKNEGGKAENADADITAYFEALKLIIYVQAKHHTGETSQWAVRQISDYREQKENETDDNTYVSWVISTCDRFSPEAIKLARESNVRLINGLDFAEMLINAGLNENMNEALNG